jgi:hypothetical protein
MTQVLPSRRNPTRSYAAIALFLVVYVGVLLVVFAPREMISVQSGSVLRDAD